MPLLPISTCGDVGIAISFDFEMIKHDGYLLIVLGQKKVRAVHVRWIIGGISGTIQFATFFGSTDVGEAATAIRSGSARYLVFCFKNVSGLETASLQFAGTENHRQTWSVTNHTLSFISTQFIIEFIVCVGSLLPLQIDF